VELEVDVVWKRIGLFVLGMSVVNVAHAAGVGKLTLAGDGGGNVFISRPAVGYDTANGHHFTVTGFRSPTPVIIDIIASDDVTNTSVRLFFQASDGGYLGPGTYNNATNYTGALGPRPAVGFSGGCDEFGGEAGEFTILDAEYESRPNTSFNVRRFAMTFRMRCQNAGGGEITGTFSWANDAEPGNTPFDPAGMPSGTGDGTGGGGGGGGTGGGGGGGGTPAPAPPPFQLGVSDDLATTPLVITNGATQTIAFTSAITSAFNSDLQLSVTSNAADTDDFRVSMTPDKFAAPGSGEGKVTITTGPMTFPRTYVVTLNATDGTQNFSRSFLVQVQCDPPSILGTNQPKSTTATNGGSFEMTVVPSGSGPFFYQWYRGARGMTRWPVAGATGPKMTTASRENDSYWVRVSNACGSVDSVAANVEVTTLLRKTPPKSKGKSGGN
jgi:hypothetical protein